MIESWDGIDILKTPQMITFTSSAGDQNHGIIIGAGDELVEVIWETFTELIARLSAGKGRIKDRDRANLSARITWVKPAQPGSDYGSVLSPLAESDRNWETPNQRKLHRGAMDGTFAEVLERIRSGS